MLSTSGLTGGYIVSKYGSWENVEASLHQFLLSFCAPADIAYLTDLTLLNEEREKLEIMIDRLHAPDQGQERKPRTYRQKARRAYLAVAKGRRKSTGTWRKSIGQQLRYVARNQRILKRYQGRLSCLGLACIGSYWCFRNCTVNHMRCTWKRATTSKTGS